MAPTALLALAAAIGIARGTWSIHQSRVPSETAKTKASNIPRNVICRLRIIPHPSSLEVDPNHSDPKEAKK
jgi:hypothetical protein